MTKEIKTLSVQDLSIGDVFYFIEYESIESVCFGGSDENGIFDFEDEDAYYSFDQLGDIYATYENAQNALNNDY